MSQVPAYSLGRRFAFGCLALGLSLPALADVRGESAVAEAAETLYVNRPDTHTLDRQLAENVRSSLAADPLLRHETIAVSVQNGVLHLGGEMSSVAMLYRVIETARKVPGVARINDSALM